MIRYKIILPLFLVFCLVGCGQRDASPVVQRDASPVVARVGQHVLTESEVSRRAALVAALTEHKTGKTNMTARLHKIYQKGYAMFWAEGCVLADYAAAKGLQVSEEALEKHRQNAFQNFRTRKDKNYEQMIAAALPKGDVDLWNQQVRDESLRQVLKQHFVELYPTNFGETYATAEIAKMQAWNARMVLTNALQFAKATNVWQRIVRGEDFVKVAKATTELDDEIEDDCEWTAVDDKMLTDEPELKAALVTMKVGDVTPPIRADNGLIIARFDRVEDDGAKALSRIFFHLPRFLTPAPKEVIIKRAYDDYENDLFKRKVAELVSAAKIEYFKNGKEAKKGK